MLVKDVKDVTFYKHANVFAVTGMKHLEVCMSVESMYVCLCFEISPTASG